MVSNSHILKLDSDILTADNAHWGQLFGCGLSLALAELSRSLHGPMVIVTPDTHTASQLSEEIEFFLGQGAARMLHFPDWETLPYDLFSPYEDIISQRLRTLQLLSHNKKSLLIVPIATLLQKITPADWLDANSLMLQPGQTLDPMHFRQHLNSAGYRAVTQVITHGEYALRGSLIDVFPMGSDKPLRIDLFDDEIDTIRTFDPETQRSEDKLDQVKILPAKEFPLDEDAVQYFRSRYRQRFEGDPQQSPVYKSVSDGIPCGGIEYYLPLFFEQTATLFDYIPKNSLFCLLQDSLATAEEYYVGVEARYQQRKHDLERPVLSPPELFLTPELLNQQLDQEHVLMIERFKLDDSSLQFKEGETTDNKTGFNFNAKALPDLLLKPRMEDPAIAIRQYIHKTEGKILFTADSTGRREFMLETLRPFDIMPDTVTDWHDFLNRENRFGLAVSPIEAGVHCLNDAISIIPEHQLIPGRTAQTRKKRRRKTADSDAIIRNLTELNIGSPVVHEDNGVGRYLGLQRIVVGGVDNEFLALEYAGGDKLYVPVSALHLISRYTGADEDHAPLHKLGTDTWNRVKKRAAQKARDVAVELLDIYARRAAKRGHAYILDQPEYLAFVSAFPFEETEDQAKAIEDVITDMQSEQPMDRVVCGDVGFGKTEVALRAAFVAVNSGKQVAILVPTTLLAEQHNKSFTDRFADWPVRVETLSRFRSVKEQKEILAEMQKGTVDIVIGTHKLLQSDIKFSNLGLVVIDEEQRFGVRHKEKLKSLRAEVDMLTLTATPIPRTLNMSLSGLRDLSIIATPPMLRHAIKTFVSTVDHNLIKEACLRELSRGGQIFYLHNKVKTIEKAARELQELIPEASIEIAHGQMRESQLEQVMLDFHHQRFSILVCTTIIETGIDIANANTIIINHADKFGLSQLHQLRGRVGRSHHRAYAYLMTPERKSMTADAIKRLEAIESLEDLGIGFTLASHDLEIRGAGDLLGEGQSGQIQEIGFSMYNELLERAVKALKEGKDLDTLPPRHFAEVDLGEPALIPDDYIPDVHTRLILYKRISAATDKQALKELKIEMIDRFGLLPDTTITLFNVTSLKMIATPLGIRKIDVGPVSGRFIFEKNPTLNVKALLTLVQGEPQNYQLKGNESLHFNLNEDMETLSLVQWIKTLLQKLTPEPVTV